MALFHYGNRTAHPEHSTLAIQQSHGVSNFSLLKFYHVPLTQLLYTSSIKSLPWSSISARRYSKQLPAGHSPAQLQALTFRLLQFRSGKGFKKVEKAAQLLFAKYNLGWSAALGTVQTNVTQYQHGFKTTLQKNKHLISIKYTNYANDATISLRPTVANQNSSRPLHTH